jgi:V/A-type H+-transporting ATPase subunit D
MAIKVQYNKTAIQQYQRQLAIREKALPTLKSKETALRVEVKKTSDHLGQLKEDLQKLFEAMQGMMKLWVEFPEVVYVEDTDISIKNIAGVRIPILNDIRFGLREFSLYHQRPWIPAGLERLKEIIRLKTEIKVYQKQFDILNYARKKTTQKVNLYEKVQIPEFRDAIRRVKRYLEDKENLEKAAQKIVKERNKVNEALR